MESITTLNRTCPNCGKRITGRRGKRFCSDRCRTDSHNQAKQKTIHNPFVRKVTSTLMKNRNILQTELGENNSVKTTVNSLTERGFNFKYHTNTFHNGDRTYYYSYDYGYLSLKDNWCLIVRLNK